MKEIIEKDKNILFKSSPHKEMKNYTDDEVIQHLESAIVQGWNVLKVYGGEYDNYNALHACAMNYHFKSALWLLDKGIDPNTRSGNDNTAFTFLVSSVHNNNIKVKDLLDFSEKLKLYGGDLKISGYDNESALILYSRYNTILEEPIINYLIKNSDFENTFLLNDILKDYKLLTVKNLKKIIQEHKIDLKKVKPVDEKSSNPETYWDTIAFNLSHRYNKERYQYITWLHNKLGFDLDSWHTYHDYDGRNDYKYHVNVLGLAIQNRNRNLYDWILKRRPEQLNDKFYMDDKAYNLLEFSLLSDFRTGILQSLRNMKKEEILELNVPKLKSLCKNNSNHLTLETFQKTYTAIVYRNMLNKYENMNTNKSKKMKI